MLDFLQLTFIYYKLNTNLCLYPIFLFTNDTMIIKTKKYTLTPKEYLRIAMKHRFKTDWFVYAIAGAVMCLTLLIHSIWFIITAVIGMGLYFLFWLVQYYGIRYLEQTQLLFTPSSYEISGKQILIKFSPTKGMPLEWKSIKKVFCNKDNFLIVISKAHLISLPHKVFYSEHDVKFFKFLLTNKGFFNAK